MEDPGRRRSPNKKQQDANQNYEYHKVEAEARRRAEDERRRRDVEERARRKIQEKAQLQAECSVTGSVPGMLSEREVATDAGDCNASGHDESEAKAAAGGGNEARILRELEERIRHQTEKKRATRNGGESAC